MTESLKDLHEKRGRLITQAREALDEIKTNTDESRTKELEERHDKIMSEYDSVEKTIEREKKLAEIEERARKTQESRRPGQEDASSDEREQATSDAEYRGVWLKAIRHGVTELSSEERSVLARGRVADLPAEIRAQSTTTTAGGYTVPQGFSGELDKALAMWGPMFDANIVREMRTAAGNAIPWPTIDDTSQTGEGPKTENAAATDDASGDMTFGQKTLNAYIYDTKVVKVSFELLQDSAFDIEQMLIDLFAERLGRRGNTALTTGTGSSQPQGIVTGASSGKTAASASAITADELIDLQHSVDPAYRLSPKCRFMFNDSTLQAIRKLKDGQGNYLFQMGNIQTGAPDTLLGKPYSINQAMASIATGNKTVLFGDFSRFVVRKVRDITTLRLNERYAEALQVGFIGFSRFDGRVLNSAAIKYLVQA